MGGIEDLPTPRTLAEALAQIVVLREIVSELKARIEVWEARGNRSSQNRG